MIDDILRNNHLTIGASQKPINLEISAPPSKSFTHRALILAALAEGRSVITNPLVCNDTNYTLSALEKMGTKINQTKDSIIVHGKSGKLETKKQIIYLGNSGTSLRLLTGLATLSTEEIVLTGSKRLQERPMAPLIQALTDWGAEIFCLKETGRAPITVKPGLMGGVTSLRGDISSQFFSSLLLVSPFAKSDCKIRSTTKISSQPYIDLTLQLMEKFGVQTKHKDEAFDMAVGQRYQANNCIVEGDYSSASYLFAMVAICGGKIKVTGLNPESLQPDKKILACLEKMGCSIVSGANWWKVSRHPKETIEGIKINMEDAPDIVPTLAAVSYFAKSPTTITNIGHLRFKESDRILALANELQKLGATVEQTDDSLTIYPSTKKQGGVIETYNDHRIAMAISLIGMKVPNVHISNPNCVKKSFPEFFRVLDHVNNKRGKRT
jgi:3-phosphoshikimate 1-carboxyvinyltransferase